MSKKENIATHGSLGPLGVEPDLHTVLVSILMENFNNLRLQVATSPVSMLRTSLQNHLPLELEGLPGSYWQQAPSKPARCDGSLPEISLLR